MKRSKADTAETRKRIIEVAAKAFRSRGIEATGVAEIMAAAGMSHGGFYRHFDSKDQLVAEALGANGKDLVSDFVAAAEEGATAVLDVFQDYVTPAARDEKEIGCPLAANGSELVRADARVRHAATQGFQKIISAVSPFMTSETDEEAEEVSISVITNVIGALTMSRMVDDPALSDRILDVAKQRIAGSIDVVAKDREREPQKKAA
jgi:TetR/AcrR family transcriptional repressor of nem operon